MKTSGSLSRARAFGQNLERRRIQRIRLAAQLGSNCGGVLMCSMSRQSVCIHKTICGCRYAGRASQKGKFVVIVEHDEETNAPRGSTCRSWPRAGMHGGEVVRKEVCATLNAQKTPRLDALTIARLSSSGIRAAPWRCRKLDRDPRTPPIFEGR